MIITGYMLRAEIRAWEQKRDVASRLFDDALYAFSADEKGSPQEYADAFTTAEERIAQLQTLQMRYNLAVEVDIQGEQYPLTMAVKMVGGAGRLEAMWKAALPQRDRYAYRKEVRAADSEVQALQITQAKVMEFLGEARTRADAIRTAIGLGNAVEISFDDAYQSLFD